jgi:hypothetical protein
MAWPARTHYAYERSLTVGDLYGKRRRMLENPEEEMKFLDGDRFVCGYVLPDFQRGHRWSQEQGVAFVESLILGHHPGHFKYNSTLNMPFVEIDGREVSQFNLWLIDGQQRLTALDAYWDDEFPVFDLYWSEVEVRDQRRLWNMVFPAGEYQIADYHELVDVYWTLNRGGVPHTDEEMSLAIRR